MEKTAESNKYKDTTACGTTRKLKISLRATRCRTNFKAIPFTSEHSFWWAYIYLHKTKADEKSGITKIAKGGTRRVTQPKYEVAGQSLEDSLEEYPVFSKWVEWCNKGNNSYFSAKVSAARNETDKHVICIYNDNFLNEADVFALRDGIRNAGIEKPLKYKANIFTHLGIDRQNKWGIDQFCIEKQDEQCPTLKRSKKSCGTKITKTIARRDERRQYESLFNLGYDRKASKSAVSTLYLKW
ncbi:unnamed protein product [Mytilus coruscus]|uniref:Uncharacterized protein n=1 Tax=Mytilus coruscus TaxID=42192 RepID=A0A6J8APK3_MYTCO|nr:unnamed protein product [Mytilus coruscus]